MGPTMAAPLMLLRAWDGWGERALRLDHFGIRPAKRQRRRIRPDERYASVFHGDGARGRVALVGNMGVDALRPQPRQIFVGINRNARRIKIAEVQIIVRHRLQPTQCAVAVITQNKYQLPELL